MDLIYSNNGLIVRVLKLKNIDKILFYGEIASFEIGNTGILETAFGPQIKEYFDILTNGVK